MVLIKIDRNPQLAKSLLTHLNSMTTEQVTLTYDQAAKRLAFDIREIFDASAKNIRLDRKKKMLRFLLDIRNVSGHIKTLTSIYLSEDTLYHVICTTLASIYDEDEQTLLQISDSFALQDQSQNNRSSQENLEIYPYQSSSIRGHLYRNRQFSFRIVFPEHWQIKRGDGPNIVVKAVENTGKSINVWVRDIKAQFSADNIPSSLLLESAKEAFPDAKLIDSGSTHINNKPAKYIIYDASYSVPVMHVKVRMISYWVINSQKLFIITGGAEPEQFAPYKAIIDLAVSTLIFEDGFY